MIIRPEQPEDIADIRAVTRSAFVGLEHSSQTEAAIVDALRTADALTLSLVAEQDSRIIGHAAFSLVRIDGRASHWFGQGPVSEEGRVERPTPSGLPLHQQACRPPSR